MIPVVDLCSPDPKAPALTLLMSGIHLVVPRITDEHAVVVSARSDGRVFFLLPFFGRTLIGTTDRDTSNSPDRLEIQAEDVDYLLTETNLVMDRACLTRDDVISSFIGVRTLATDDSARPSTTSREQQIWEEPEGVVHVIGGKFTTWRLIAHELLQRATTAAGLAIDDGRRSRTEAIVKNGLYLPSQMPEDLTPLIDLARRTHALTAEDLLRRRTPIMLTDPPGSAAVAALDERLSSLVGGNR